MTFFFFFLLIKCCSNCWNFIRTSKIDDILKNWRLWEWSRDILLGGQFSRLHTVIRENRKDLTIVISRRHSRQLSNKLLKNNNNNIDQKRHRQLNAIYIYIYIYTCISLMKSDETFSKQIDFRSSIP